MNDYHGGNGHRSIRVLVADDHAVVRSGLATFLSAYDDLHLVGEAPTGERALALCGILHPDVVLMDLIMPGMGGVAATSEIRRLYPDVQVIILTSFSDEDLVQAALRAGAIGYLLKNISAFDLAVSIREACLGRPALAPEAAEALVHATARPHPHTPDLTDRERDVLNLLAEGYNNIEIAERMHVSRSTVKFHVSNILSKLGVSSRTEAVALSLHEHLVS